MCSKQSDSRLVHIEATVTRHTFESLQRSQEETRLTMGEVIDRMALYAKAPNPDWALRLILEEIKIIISDLTNEEKDETLCNVLIYLAALLPPKNIDRIQEAAKAKRESLLHEMEKRAGNPLK